MVHAFFNLRCRGSTGVTSCQLPLAHERVIAACTSATRKASAIQEIPDAPPQLTLPLMRFDSFQIIVAEAYPFAGV